MVLNYKELLGWIFFGETLGQNWPSYYIFSLFTGRLLTPSYISTISKCNDPFHKILVKANKMCTPDVVILSQSICPTSPDSIFVLLFFIFDQVNQKSMVHVFCVQGCSDTSSWSLLTSHNWSVIDAQYSSTCYILLWNCISNGEDLCWFHIIFYFFSVSCSFLFFTNKNIFFFIFLIFPQEHFFTVFEREEGRERNINAREKHQ